MPAVGSNVLRKDGRDKVSGAAKYADDLAFPGMIHGRTIRSTIPRGTITSVRFASDAAGFTIADWRDIPSTGKNVIALIDGDQPALVERDVHHMAEPILLIAHADREVLEAATVEIEYDELLPVFDPLESEVALKRLLIEKGDVEAALQRADLIIEGEYRTGSQEHVYIEPNIVIAVPEGDGITIYGSIQCPFYVQKAMRSLLGWPDSRIRVVQTETGGGFGGKEEYPSMLAAHAAILAIKAQRPVKILYDRTEDMLATTKRHPSIVRHRTGVTKEGRLVAMDIEVILDGGAYVTLSPVVLSRGCIHAAGPYRCAHTRIAGRAMLTHTPPNGAFRGFGAPQTLFAMEVHMDRIAEALNLDPLTIRQRNALRAGDTTATGQVMQADCTALETLKRAAKRTAFRRKWRDWRGTNKGIGIALFFHGSGFTGAGEVHLASQASLEATPDGVRILVASTEIGQGTRTMHSQIVADALGVDYEHVIPVIPDTHAVPDSGPTVASRTCMVVGKILQQCAEAMRERCAPLSPMDYARTHGSFIVTRQYEKPSDVVWDDILYRGDAYATFGWACDVAEVELDAVTYEVKPTRITCVQDVGRAIHPMLVAGQIEGGTAQGVGWALLEDVVMRNGAMANNQLTNYIIPTTLDTPRMDVEIMETPGSHGPHGAKGIGEMPMDGPAPAIVNAIRHLGLDMRSIPATPEKVMELAAR